MSQAPLRHYLQVLRRHVALLILIPACAIAAAALVTAGQDPVYHADMKIFVGQAGGGVQPSIGTQALTQTMSNLLESDVVARTAIERLRIDTTPKEVARKLKVSVKPDSSVLDVGLDWSDRRQAVALLNEIADVFTRLVKEKLGLSSSSTTLGSQSSRVLFFASVFDPPHVAPDQVSPRPARNVGFAAALGLLLGVVFAFFRDNLDDRIRGRRDAETSFNAPVIGALPRGAHSHPLDTLRSSDGDRRGIAEAVRIMGANMRFSVWNVDGPMVLVTSSQEREGKTTVAACVGLALAAGGKRVVCVDADLRRPKLHELLGVEPRDGGLKGVIQGRTRLEDALQDVEFAPLSRNGAGGSAPAHTASLKLLPAGGPGSRDVILEADTIKGLVEQLTQHADYVIFDAPPLPSSGDTFALALHSDNIIVAARDGRTTKGRAEGVRETLQGLGAAKRVAVVLTHTGPHETYAERG
jgi:capsular polysaccharide biosynthesis protein/MinD-like ATPase involved in chromosome partitioning or flagellar assembly